MKLTFPNPFKRLRNAWRWAKTPPQPGVYEVYMPSPNGNMMCRVLAVSMQDAWREATDWFTKDEDGPHDQIRGMVTVKPAPPDLPPYWKTKAASEAGL